MLTATELKELKVGDEIDSGAFIFEGLPDAEYVLFTVTRVSSKVVEFDLTYFGVSIGNWVAKPCANGSVLWIDQGKSRESARKKGVLQ